MENIIINRSLSANFFVSDEKEFFIQHLGYNDLSQIAPVYKEHTKHTFMIHIILSGEGILNIYGKQYHLKKYDMFFIPPNVNVSYYPKKENPWKYVWFEFSGNNSLIYSEKLGFSSQNAVVKCKNGAEAEAEIYEILNTLSREKEIGYYSVLSLFYKLMDFNENRRNKTEVFSDQILIYLNLHYHNPNLKIEDICKDFNISHSGLCKIFKKDFGITVKHQLIKIRISKAKALLQNSSLSVEEVGYSVGFSDNFHFMKTFKAYTGISAGEFKKSNK